MGQACERYTGFHLEIVPRGCKMSEYEIEGVGGRLFTMKKKEPDTKSLALVAG